MCISDTCNDGYYSDILSGVEQAIASLAGDLEIGSDVCLPCDETCALCNGPGTRIALDSCLTCKCPSQGNHCVGGCDIHMGEKIVSYLNIIMIIATWYWNINHYNNNRWRNLAWGQ